MQSQSLLSQKNLTAQKWVVLIAITLFVLKTIAWYLTQSVTVLTDAMESTVNVVAGLVSLYSLYVASRPRDEEHPYGHGKAEFVAAAVEGVLVTLAGILILIETLKDIRNPHEVKHLDLGLLLVCMSGAVNFIAGALCIKEGKKNNSPALIASGKHLQTDAWSTIAVVGGLILLWVTGWKWVDPAFALVMGTFVTYTGYTIVRSSLAGIMDEADKQLLKEMITVLQANRIPEWVDLHHLRIVKYGSVLHLDCHVTVPWYINVHQAHDAVDALTQLIQQHFGEMIEFSVHTDGCLPFSCQICDLADCKERKQAFVQRIDWTLENILQNQKHRLTETHNEVSK